MSTEFNNKTIIQRIEEELGTRSDVVWLLIAVALAQIWVIYLTYFNSRVIGLILTAILNKFFIKLGHIHIGSLTFSVLSGKVMFRDVYFVTEDYSIKTSYGWLIFRWWKPYVYKGISEDFSHSDTRLFSSIEGFEVHVYNMSKNYAHLEKLFGLPNLIIPNKEADEKPPEEQERDSRVTEVKQGRHWRDLIPVIKIDINTGRVLFGNHLVPNTLVVNFDDAHIVYTTKPASTPFDIFMHVTKCSADNVRVMLVPSPKYTGPDDEPPRFMGEGFVVMQSNTVEIYYFMDEPGIVPHEPELVHLADGETVIKRTNPCIGVDIRCGKNTDFNYGPWVDRQREHLWKFFYPPDYQRLEPTKIAEAGELRQYKTFEFRTNMLCDTTIDILFTKNSVTQALHMCTKAGSYIEVMIPWITEETGYVSKFKGQFLLLDATTSMIFRSFVEAETLEFDVSVSYPSMWNDHQDWRCDLTGCKASVWLIFEHKNFFKDLIEDWSSKTVPDIYHFIPYTWTINLIIKEVEIITMTNQYNWIDTASQNEENAHIAFCGDLIELSLVLPYTDFLPLVVHVPLVIRGENAWCRLHLPENNTSRYVVMSISENMKLMDGSGNLLDGPFECMKGWRKRTLKSAGWVDCWKSPLAAVSIGYAYHPMPLLRMERKGQAAQELIDLSTPEKEEALLIPLRPLRSRSFGQSFADDFDAGTMDPDVISVEVEVGPSVVCVYGQLLRNFLHIKENYLGEDQVYTELSSKTGKDAMSFVNMAAPEDDKQYFDSREYRPFCVTVSLTLFDIQAHLVKNCNENDIPCPALFVERLCFEMDKRYQETKLQVLLSPVTLFCKDGGQRSDEHKHLKDGHLTLSGLQVRGHAMFSHECLPLESETLEYAWLVEAIIGNITGKITSPQLQNIAEFMQTFVMLVEDVENNYEHPATFKLCQHGLPQSQCRMLPQYTFKCPSSEDIKYCMTRLSVDYIDLFMVESGCAMNIQIDPIRLSTCNLHGTNTRAGITGILDKISFRQFITTGPFSPYRDKSDIWLESGSFVIGPIHLEAAMALPSPEFHSIQDDFLKLHDRKTKRLWFLWPSECVSILPIVNGKCGCLGGCRFFGNNRNGIGFFTTRKHSVSRHAAIFQLFPEGSDPGFGQSLLQKNTFIFDVLHETLAPSPSSTPQGFSFTRGYMSNIASPETPSTSVTLVESIQKLDSASQTISKLSCDTSTPEPMYDTTNLPHSPQNSSFSSSQTNTSSSSQSDTLYEGSIKDVFGSDRTITTPSEVDITSWPSMTSGSIQLESPTHFTDCVSSLDELSYKTARADSCSFGSLIQSSPTFKYRHDSKGSLTSGTMSYKSMRSSMSSPKSLRHFPSSRSSYSAGRITSSASIESESYYSAEEDSLSLQDSDLQQFNRTLTTETLCEENEIPTLSEFSTTIIEKSIAENPKKRKLKKQQSTDIESDTTSTSSFTSAESDVEIGELPPGSSLVNLHSQMNQPITSSAILMSCYSCHLTHLQCSDWSSPSTAQQPIIVGKADNLDKSTYSDSSVTQSLMNTAQIWTPNFKWVKTGFQTGIMKEKDGLNINSSSTDGQSDPWAQVLDGREKEELQGDQDTTEMLDNVSKTTAVIKVKGSVDMLLTPLLLESFQRYTESVVDTLKTLHPSSVIDGLHGRCLESLKLKNKLKKEKMGQTDEEGETDITTTQENNKNETKSSKTTSIQALFSLSKINICVLQSALVEEVVSFSALEHIHELTCVSLMAVCVKDIRCQFLTNSRSCRVTQEGSPASSLQRPGEVAPPKKNKNEASQTEAETEKLTEIIREENVGTLNISKVHFQMRRLIKNSNYADQIILTAIPENRSKVLFTFAKEKLISNLQNSGVVPSSPKTPKLQRQLSKESRRQEDPSNGFIMFECGLEDINITAVRRLGYKDITDWEFQQKLETIAKTLQDMQEGAKRDVEDVVDGQNKDKQPSEQQEEFSSTKSNDSRVSLSSSVSSIQTADPLKGDASSGILHLKTVWFNFAAPPQMPIKRKVDFTKLDWNLLSTATPAINAWMNPSDRLITEMRRMIGALSYRTCTVMACVMTEALDVQNIHMPYRSKYNKLTKFSRTLQEDASCQLLTVLLKYLYKCGTNVVDDAVYTNVPQLITVQKGILALTRQWKNTLYMPQLSDMTFKKKKAKSYTVTFSPFTEIESFENIDEAAQVEQYEIVDEKTSLLQAEGGSICQSASVHSIQPTYNKLSGHDHQDTVGNEHIEQDGSTASFHTAKQRPVSGILSTLTGKAKGFVKRSSFDSPDRFTQANQANQSASNKANLIRNDSTYSFQSAPASSLSGGECPTSPPLTPLKTGPFKSSIMRRKQHEQYHNLYKWMAKHSEEFHNKPPELHRPFDRTDSYIAAFQNYWQQDESKTDINAEQMTYATSIMQLADAQILFKPLLQAMGLHVEGVRASALMKRFGGNVSLQGKLDILKIQIADSDSSGAKGKGKGKSSYKKFSKFVNITPDTPTFLCENFSVNIALKDVEDFESKEADKTGAPNRNFTWKFAMHKLEAKPATLQVNFKINCNSVTQYVDMPLLRLIHQFVIVVDNIKDTKKELKQNRPDDEYMKTHRKQESKGSTSSADTQHSELSKSRTNLATADAQTPTLEGSVSAFESDKKSDRKSKLSSPSLRLSLDLRRPDKLPVTSSVKKTPKSSQRFKQDTPSQFSDPSFTPMQSLNLSDSVAIDMEDTSSPAFAEKTIEDEIKANTPKCWRTLYHLLDLYATMPETKTIGQYPTIPFSKLPVIEEEPDFDGSSKRDGSSRSGLTDSTRNQEKSKLEQIISEESDIGKEGFKTRPSLSQTTFRQSLYIGESIPLVVFGIAKIERVKMLAVLSGLKLESELRNVHASGTYREKIKGFPHRKSSECSGSAHVGHTMIVLKEGKPPNMQTVVTVHIAKSQGLYTTIMRRGKDHNSALISIGIIDVDIPQHPVVLHGMMTRSSRHISNTLQEFRRPISKSGKTDTLEVDLAELMKMNAELRTDENDKAKKEQEKKPAMLNIHVKAVLHGIITGASLLPSLKAQHRTGCISINGMTGKKTRFTMDLPSHTLSFRSEVSTTETSIPTQASIELPPIHVYTDYRYYKAKSKVSETLMEGMVLKEGNYCNSVAEVGMLEHSLTTDLLNHLVFVQKVFMKEVNELVQKVSGSDQPVPLWTNEGQTQPYKRSIKPSILYSLLFRFKGIQITATTPTSSAVRLETGAIDMEISNRVQMSSREHDPEIVYEDNDKVFIKAEVDLNVSLGQLHKNPMFEEADPEFQTMAFFKTKIGIRNALQDEMIAGVSPDQEALLINLTRPIILAQPLAFDKAVLVWLNYKNAYEYWTEQRLALNKEVQTATRQFIDKLPQLTSSTPALSTLFLQLTVDDLGICVPLGSFSSQNQQTSIVAENDMCAALVLTVESTQITACSSGSLVSKGKFTGFSFRLADDFETSWDDWKPDDKAGPVMNICEVPDGTYEVCSRTINKQASDPYSNAKWILNVQWEMKGIGIDLDTSIGKKLSLLGQTLTEFTGEQENEEVVDKSESDDDDLDSDSSSDDFDYDPLIRRVSIIDEALLPEILDPRLDPKQRVRLIEKQMNEQARIVQDLKQLQASQSTIETEVKKLEELKALLFEDFKRDVFNRLKKQGEKASIIKEKLGLSQKPTHSRSKSYGGQHGKRRDSIHEIEVAPTSPVAEIENRTMSLDRHGAARVQFCSSDTVIGKRKGTLRSMQSEDDSTLKHLPEAPEFELSQKRWSLQDILGSSDSLSSSATDDDVLAADFENRFSSSVTSSDFKTLKADTSNVSGAGNKIVQEPNIDFELDVKVFIDSGKCVLHPKDKEHKEEEAKRNRKPSDSPTAKRKLKKQETVTPIVSAPGKKGAQTNQLQIENTVFFLPSVDVKVHYNSKTGPGDSTTPAAVTQLPNVPRPLSVFKEAEHLTDLTDDTTEPEEVIMRHKQRPMTSSTSSHGSSTNPAIVIESCMENKDNKDIGTPCAASTKKGSVKKANLYAWLSLQSLPEDMIISPSLLDFLEQTLDLIPMSQPSHRKDTRGSKNAVNNELDNSVASLTPPSIGLGSFPVDVVVYIRVEPSIIRFNCNPISRVECMLQVPSLEVVFSTKRSDVENYIGESTPPLKTKVPKRGRERSYSGGKGSYAPRPRMGSTASEQTQSSPQAGGLSFTGCLTDFSLYIFHPYGGGGQRKVTQATPTVSQLKKSALGSILENGAAALSEFGRKDSLSLNVEFIKVNISRTRKLDTKTGGNEGSSGSVKSDSMLKSNIVRFSATCDIGTASFKYDMRRLTEILSFPKAWYRRNLARRMFLGDDSMAQGMFDEDCESSSSSTASVSSEPCKKFNIPSKSNIFTSSPALHDHNLEQFRKSHHRRVSSGDKIKIQLSNDLKKEIDKRASTKKVVVSAPQSPSDVAGESFSYFHHKPHRGSTKSRSSHPFTPDLSRNRTTSHTSASPSSWETLVLFAVNLTELDVVVNMSNVMGNTKWSTTALKCQGRLSIGSSGHKNMKIKTGLQGSTFESKGGVCGGHINIQDLDTFFEILEDPELGKEPDHKAGLSLFAIEGRLDYMGSSVLMTRLSNLELSLQDDWHIDMQKDADTPVATTRPASLYVNGDLDFDKFHLMISRSTTPDLLKMVAKLEEFFTMQFTSSKRALSAFGPISASKQRSSTRRKLSDDGFSDIRHHRHWNSALERISGCKFTMLPTILPAEGTILGGTFTLKGNNMSLACFHGINFRSKSWAIFTMKGPYTSFSTEALQTEDRGCNVIQDLKFFIGYNMIQHPIEQVQSMATICKLSRGQYMPPPFTSVQDWFHYAFASSEIKDLDCFPSMQRQRCESPSEHKKFKKHQDYSHETDVIFALPSLQMQLRTIHNQDAEEPGPEDPKPIVEASFVTEFDDHIFVAMDAEIIMFLHDLVSTYMKEKDTGNAGKSAKSPDSEKKKVPDPTAVLKQDWREFVCKTWKLEPTLRLLHWANKQIDPVGADYVLNKLGFSHARTTIPKWLQRGLMDPLDSLLSFIVERIITILKDSPEKISEYNQT